MEQAQEKHIIWSDINLDDGAWRAELEEEYPDRTEDEYMYLMDEINQGYLDDERCNLDIQLSTPIIVCGDLGLWNGRRMGYQMIDSGNIRDCLFGDCDYHEWYVDRQGDLRCTAIHHDGTNHYLYRAVKEHVPDWKVERLQEKLYNGTAQDKDIAAVTRRLGDEIAAVYGFPIERKEEEPGGMTMAVDVLDEELEEVTLSGRTGYYTELRVDRETVPEGICCYELRHGDDRGLPAAVGKDAGADYFGAVFFTEPLDLGDGGYLPVGQDDFEYTGRIMNLSQVLEEKEPDRFRDGKTLSAFLENTFPVTEEEGKKLLGYMEGHGYLLGYKNGELYRGDVCHGQEKVEWEPYFIDDAVNDASEWNFQMLKEAETAVSETEAMDDFVEKSSRLDDLRKDEEILDGMFDRTRYGKELDALAVTLAEELIRDMDGKGGLDTAVKKMTEQIKAGEDMLPDVSPALKKDPGRKR